MIKSVPTPKSKIPKINFESEEDIEKLKSPGVDVMEDVYNSPYSEIPAMIPITSPTRAPVSYNVSMNFISDPDLISDTSSLASESSNGLDYRMKLYQNQNQKLQSHQIRIAASQVATNEPWTYLSLDVRKALCANRFTLLQINEALRGLRNEEIANMDIATSLLLVQGTTEIHPTNTISNTPYMSTKGTQRAPSSRPSSRPGSRRSSFTSPIPNEPFWTQDISKSDYSIRKKKINAIYTDREYNVRFVYPGNDTEADIKIPKDFDLTTLKQYLLDKSLPTTARQVYSLSVDKVTIFYVDDNGWAIRVGKQQVKDKHTNDFLLIDILCFGKDHSTLFLGTTYDAIRPRTKLHYLYAGPDSSSSLIQKVNILMQSYSGFRSVLPDGNCYYRAIIFATLEQLVFNGNRKRFYELYTIMKKVNYPNTKLNTLHKSILDILIKASNGKALRNSFELESFYLQVDVDIILVRACRRIVSKFILKNLDMDVNGITLVKSIMISYPRYRSIQEYCDEEIDKMGKDAEGPHVHLGLLLKLLHIDGFIVYFDKRDEVDIKIIPNGVQMIKEKESKVDEIIKVTNERHPMTKLKSFFSTSMSTLTPIDIDTNIQSTTSTTSTTIASKSPNIQAIATIHLLFIPGHYDIIYCNSCKFMPRDLTINEDDHLNTTCNSIVDDKSILNDETVDSKQQKNKIRFNFPSESDVMNLTNTTSSNSIANVMMNTTSSITNNRIHEMQPNETQLDLNEDAEIVVNDEMLRDSIRMITNANVNPPEPNEDLEVEDTTAIVNIPTPTPNASIPIVDETNSSCCVDLMLMLGLKRKPTTSTQMTNSNMTNRNPPSIEVVANVEDVSHVVVVDDIHVVQEQGQGLGLGISNANVNCNANVNAVDALESDSVRVDASYIQ